MLSGRSGMLFRSILLHTRLPYNIITLYNYLKRSYSQVRVGVFSQATKGGSDWTSGRIPSWKVFLSIGAGCPGRWRCHHPRRCWRKDWMCWIFNMLTKRTFCNMEHHRPCHWSGLHRKRWRNDTIINKGKEYWWWWRNTACEYQCWYKRTIVTKEIFSSVQYIPFLLFRM